MHAPALNKYLVDRSQVYYSLWRCTCAAHYFSAPKLDSCDVARQHNTEMLDSMFLLFCLTRWAIGWNAHRCPMAARKDANFFPRQTHSRYMFVHTRIKNSIQVKQRMTRGSETIPIAVLWEEAPSLRRTSCIVASEWTRHSELSVSDACSCSSYSGSVSNRLFHLRAVCVCGSTVHLLNCILKL